MIAPVVFPSFQHAYVAVLRYVTETYEFVNSARGNDSQEIIGASFRLADPRQRALYLTSRPVNPVYHYAEALWYLGGMRNLDLIGHYANRRRADSRDGVTIEGSSYGARIFAPRPDGAPSAFDQALELLRAEKDSKRAYMPIFEARDLDEIGHPDLPCLVGLHLLAREGYLHMVTYMRANDANRGMVCDVYSFTLIQEFAAALLGLRLGSYTHHVGSMHVGLRDLERAGRVLDETAASYATVPCFAPPVMPADSTWKHIRTVLEHEELLRANRVQYTPRDVAGLDLPRYWQRVLLLFEAHRQVVNCPEVPVDQRVLDALEPGARWQFERRWPARVAAGENT
ncbi:thymidylate synthase [Streptomyces sp. 1331.2]|uniref:thymidylate synthase n=1 Tax=Streptomyces sp. 1331.2 TaxID=1938835 RepID=UPI000BCBEF87|nr:thymidylate synthase [Streptomyces sp. 1331.2]SOB88941.1 thymidylate synthase [Streptomyces sp. 1331.2]